MPIPPEDNVQSPCGTSVASLCGSGPDNVQSPCGISVCGSGPSSPDFIPLRPASVPTVRAATKRHSESEDQLFTKRGKKTGAVLMEEAVKVMKDICNQAPPPIDIPSAGDREELFGNYVASRLRLLSDEQKKQCENDIMAVLFKF